MAADPVLNLKAVDYFFDASGVLHQPGDTFTLSEREALGYIGIGAAVEAAASPAEPQLTLKAIDFFSANGVPYAPGEIFNLPEREALGLIGIGAVVELPQ